MLDIHNLDILSSFWLHFESCNECTVKIININQSYLQLYKDDSSPRLLPWEALLLLRPTLWSRYWYLPDTHYDKHPQTPLLMLSMVPAWARTDLILPNLEFMTSVAWHSQLCAWSLRWHSWGAPAWFPETSPTLDDLFYGPFAIFRGFPCKSPHGMGDWLVPDELNETKDWSEYIWVQSVINGQLWDQLHLFTAHFPHANCSVYLDFKISELHCR